MFLGFCNNSCITLTNRRRRGCSHKS